MSGSGNPFSDDEKDYEVPEAVEERLERLEYDDYGFPIDGYDYHKHLKETGKGYYIPAEDVSLAGEVRADPKAFIPVSDKSEVRHEEREALRALGVDEFENDAYVENTDEGEDYFHSLLAPEIEQKLLGVGGRDDEGDEDGESGSGAREGSSRQREQGHAVDDMTGDESGALYKRKVLVDESAERRQLEEEFDDVLRMYDDDEIGELDDDDPELRGEQPMSVVEQLVEEDDPGEDKPVAYEPDLSLKDRVAALAGPDDDEGYQGRKESEREAPMGLQVYRDRPKDKWDCETIVSTYSNLDNHPGLIAAPKRRLRVARSTKAEASSAAAVRDDDEESDEESDAESGDDERGDEEADQGSARRKGESKEEKRLRKQRVKEERRQRRAEKKKTKKEFRDEELRLRGEQVQQRLHNPATVRFR